MMGCAVLGSAGSIRRGDHATGGGHEPYDLAPTRYRCGSCRTRLGVAVSRAHVVITQRVVDMADLFAGSGDHPDVAAAFLPDSVPERAQGAGLGQELYRLHAPPIAPAASLVW